MGTPRLVRRHAPMGRMDRWNAVRWAMAGEATFGHLEAVTDAELIEAIRAGDGDAFRVIVEREAGLIFRCCYRVLGDVAEAEDAAQEAFVLGFRALGTYRGSGTLSAWLARIATRQALRRASRRRSVRAVEVAAAPGGASIDPPAGDADPLHHLVAAEADQALRDAVGRLPEPYREVVACRYFAELSIDEIARLTGRPTGTVKTHLHRGLARLRAALPAELSR